MIKGSKMSEECLQNVRDAARKRWKNMSEEAKIEWCNARKGRIPWNKGENLSEEHKKNLSIALKGRSSWNKGLTYKNMPPSIETRRKISEGNKGKIVSEETREKIKESLRKKIETQGYYWGRRGKKHSKETKEKISIWSKEKFRERKSKGLHWGPKKGYKHSPEFSEKMSKVLKKVYSNPEIKKKRLEYKNDPKYKEKVSKAMKEKWSNSIYRKNQIECQLGNRTPSGYEKKLIGIIKKYKLPYRYTGDGSFIIGFVNPDFVNTNGEKKAIEVYSNYFKEYYYGSEEKYKNWREKVFNKFGWTGIYLNDTDINKEEKEIVKIIQDYSTVAVF